MSALEVFRFDEVPVRVVDNSGEPWFIAADVCAALGLANVAQALAGLDEDEKGSISIADGTPGNPTRATVNEPGLYSLVIRSRRPEARAFKRWVTHEVLPSIRRTGTYAVAETPEQLVARALIQAQDIVARRDQQIAVLTPRAEAWDELASAEGDYSVADAAKILARSGIETGPQRLFEQLAALAWTFRASDGKWRAYAQHVSAGYLAERPQSHHHPRTGELIIDPPQVRITLRGVERLRVRLGVLRAVEAS
ncbi:BRO family protein [Microbacterium sp. A1-JK]|uniref:BRO family protein n=1 Tax=Microbacterium sp. A1-JK TaxID=3177516 RepID=UPI0038837204